MADPKRDNLAAGPDGEARCFFRERAAIREFDGGLPRAEAERLAAQDVLEWRRLTEPKGAGASQ